MNELNEREMYDVEGGAMVSELDKDLSGGGLGGTGWELIDVWDIPWRYMP